MRKLIVLLFLVLAISVFVAGHFIAAAAQAQPSSNTYASYQVSPGPQPYYSCPLLANPPANIIISNISGISAYNLNGITDYVLSPGHSGNITYGVSTPDKPDTASLDTAISFSHEVQSKKNYSIEKEGASQYKICFSAGSGGTVCRFSHTLPAASYAIVNTSSASHYGIYSYINTSTSKNGYVKLSVNVSSSAQKGTYWINIAGGPCDGGQTALLTIGASEYSGNVSAGIYS